MPFRAYKAHVGLPKRRWEERVALQAQITQVYPGMAVEFVHGSCIRLIGVEAPDRASAAVVVPLLDKLLDEQDAKQ